MKDEGRKTQSLHPSSFILALLYALLAASVLSVYFRAGDNGFLTYDDSLYVTANPHLAPPITLAKLGWAFTSFHAANWHPLAWLSHMADCGLFGVNPRAHHLVNVAFHLANTLLLFELLRRMTGQWGRSAVVAALFALHPLHVESVAWVAERKDVLCGLFFLLALLAYRAYAGKPSAARYGAVAALFTLSLMAKPMAVTLPFVLMLLDYWPLGRWTGADKDGLAAGRVRCVLEKMPLLALAVLSCIVTVAAQRHAGAIQSAEVFPWSMRLANVPIAYLQYLFKTFWPAHLAAFYPHPGPMAGMRLFRVGAGVLGLLLVSAGVWLSRRKTPYLLAGWCWFVGMLVPAIGIVQVGAQGMADRYTYLPLIGVFIAVVWGVADAGQTMRLPRVLMAGMAIAVLAACGVAASAQLQYWKDSVTLFTHALKTTGPNEFVRCALGKALLEEGRLPEAAEELLAALELDDYLTQAHTALGVVYLKQGRLADASNHLEQALRLDPNDTDAHIGLGNALNRLGRSEEAVQHYQAVLCLMPDSAEARAGLGAAFLKQDRWRDAQRELEEALRIDPRLATAHVDYGLCLQQNGARDEAIGQFAEALRLDSANAFAHINLGQALAAQGKYADAVPHFREAVRLAPETPEAHNGLGVTLLNLGQNVEAIAEFEQTAAQAPNHINAHLNLAVLYLNEGNPEKAIESLQHASAINPEDPRVKELMKSAQRQMPH